MSRDPMQQWCSRPDKRVTPEPPVTEHEQGRQQGIDQALTAVKLLDQLHCVMQLRRDSWEYRSKKTYDRPNSDDAVLLDDVTAALIDLQAPKAAHVPPATCIWTEHEDEGGWSTACGQTWCFENGGTPPEHHMRFCHACGKPLVIAEVQP